MALIVLGGLFVVIVLVVGVPEFLSRRYYRRLREDNIRRWDAFVAALNEDDEEWKRSRRGPR